MPSAIVTVCSFARHSAIVGSSGFVWQPTQIANKRKSGAANLIARAGLTMINRFTRSPIDVECFPPRWPHIEIVIPRSRRRSTALFLRYFCSLFLCPCRNRNRSTYINRKFLLSTADNISHGNRVETHVPDSIPTNLIPANCKTRMPTKYLHRHDHDQHGNRDPDDYFFFFMKAGTIRQ
jgi:hypothetical protein